jgi:hypothetical protein
VLQCLYPRLRLLADLGFASLECYVQMHDITRNMSWEAEPRCQRVRDWDDIRAFLAIQIGGDYRVGGAVLGAGGAFCLKCER